MSERKNGRPTVKTPETRERLLKAADVGYASLASIARAAGIHPDTLRTWCVEDPTLEPEIREHVEAFIDRAEAAYLTASLTDPKLAGDLLKRRRKNPYDPAAKVEVTGKDGGPLAVAADKAAGFSDDELTAAIAALEASLAEASRAALASAGIEPEEEADAAEKE